MKDLFTLKNELIDLFLDYGITCDNIAMIRMLRNKEDLEEYKKKAKEQQRKFFDLVRELDNYEK